MGKNTSRGRMPQMSTVMDQFIAHLEFLGYDIERSENGPIKAKHQMHANFLFNIFSFGGLARAFFGTNVQAKNQRSDLLDRVNAYNSIARVCRAYVDKDMDLVIEAFFPNLYDRITFGIFMDTFNNDIELLGYGNQKLAEYLN